MTDRSMTRSSCGIPTDTNRCYSINVKPFLFLRYCLIAVCECIQCTDIVLTKPYPPYGVHFLSYWLSCQYTEYTKNLPLGSYKKVRTGILGVVIIKEVNKVKKIKEDESIVVYKCPYCGAGSITINKTGAHKYGYCDVCDAAYIHYIPLPHQLAMHKDKHKIKLQIGG